MSSETRKPQKSKTQLTIEIVCCFIIIKLIFLLFNWIEAALQFDSLWWGVAPYLVSTALILMYIKLVEKKPLSSIGLTRVSLPDVTMGLGLGLIMFVIQQIPLVALGIDYSIYAAPPDWSHILIMSIFCIVCVGLSEEIAFRGFILHKSNDLFNSKVIAVIINCLLFYMFHWPPVRFVFGEFFNTTLNTIILCIFLYRSKKKGIAPLIIAHGFYDILSSCLLPVVAYYIYF